MLNSDNQKPILFFTRQIKGSTPEPILAGIRQAALKFNKKIIVMYGGIADKDPESFLYRRIDPQAISGLISWASTQDNANKDLYQLYSHVPQVHLTVHHPGALCLTGDSFHGAMEIMDHLIKEHGHTKILYIRGPESHIYAQQRYQAYVAALKKHDISFNSSLVSEWGSWDLSWGRTYTAQVLDNRHLVPGQDFTAVVCANDNLALGCLESLRTRGIRVPKQVAVTGYNDGPEASFNSPPLTSVAMPFYDQGYKAVQRICEGLKPGSEGEEILPAKIVIRQSCGCPQPLVQGVPRNKSTNQESARRVRQGRNEKQLSTPVNLGSLAQSPAMALPFARRSLGEEIKTTYVTRVSKFLHELELVCTLDDHSTAQVFNSAEDLIEFVYENSGEPHELHGLLNEVRKEVYNNHLPLQRLEIFEDLIAQLRITAAEASLRQKAQTSLAETRSNDILQSLSSKLMILQDIGDVREVIQKEAPKLGITSTTYFEAPSPRVFLEQDSKLRVIPLLGKDTEIMSGRSISLNEEFFTGTNSQFCTLYPLVQRDLGFGYLATCTDENSFKGSILESIFAQFSNNRTTTFIHRENDLIKQTIQDTLEQMSDKIQKMFQRSAEIDSHIQDGSTAMEEMVANIQGIFTTMEQVAQIVEQTASLSETAVKSIASLESQATSISEIVAIITDIAERTNMLSFNAAIEAAHAGDAGRGFSIVASEVKKLAHNTVSSANQIANMIKGVQESTGGTVHEVEKQSQLIPKILELSQSVKHALEEQRIASQSLSTVLINASEGTTSIVESLNEIIKIHEDMEIDTKTNGEN